MQTTGTGSETGRNGAEVSALRGEDSHEILNTPIHTTLYDLIAALNEVVGLDEERVVIAAVVHLLETHQVRCTGDLQGYRLVCDEMRQVTLNRQQNESLSHSEMNVSHFERMEWQGTPLSLQN